MSITLEQISAKVTARRQIYSMQGLRITLTDDQRRMIYHLSHGRRHKSIARLMECNDRDIRNASSQPPKGCSHWARSQWLQLRQSRLHRAQLRPAR